jgi:protein O-mannosyl-transferase
MKTVTYVILAFFALTFLVYGMSLGNDFVRWDDGLLIYENPIVREISPWSVTSAFTTYDPELYIPLTLLSYQFDYLIAGSNPFIYHLTSLLLHTINALLVTWFVYLLSKRKFAALFCGLLFAVHPLHTEAVAWASARKDVLSTLFFLGSLVAYIYYVRVNELTSKQVNESPTRSSRRSYIASIILFALALLAKVVAITLPVILVLIDFVEGRKIKNSLIEKLPYFGLSAIFGIIAMLGKQSAVGGLSIVEYVLIACKSTAFYVQKLVFPSGLSVLYPYTDTITLGSGEFLIPIIFCIALIGIAFLCRKQRKLITFGILFYFVTLLPSFITFAKDGDIYFASDRYSYIPSIGVSILIVLGVFRIARAKREIFRHAITAFSLVLVVFACLSWSQSRVWANSENLFRHVLIHYPDSHRARNNIGNVYRRQGKIGEAITEYELALVISQRAKTYSNLGAAYRKNGEIMEALKVYKKAIKLDPTDPEPYFGLGLVYEASGDSKQALESYNKSLDLDPTYAEVYNNIGSLRMAAGQTSLAVDAYWNAIQADRFFVQSYYNLGIAYVKVGKADDAIKAYEDAIAIHPKFTAARINLGILYYDLGKIEDSISQFKDVLGYDPENKSAISALVQMGEL